MKWLYNNRGETIALTLIILALVALATPTVYELLEYLPRGAQETPGPTRTNYNGGTLP